MYTRGEEFMCATLTSALLNHHSRELQIIFVFHKIIFWCVLSFMELLQWWCLLEEFYQPNHFKFHLVHSVFNKLLNKKKSLSLSVGSFKPRPQKNHIEISHFWIEGKIETNEVCLIASFDNPKANQFITLYYGGPRGLQRALLSAGMC